MLSCQNALAQGLGRGKRPADAVHEGWDARALDELNRERGVWKGFVGRAPTPGP